MWAIALAGLFVSLPALRPSADDGVPFRFVDINAVLDKCKAHQDATSEIKAKMSALQSDYEGKVNEIKALETQVNDAVAGTSEAEDLARRLQHVKLDADWLRKSGQAQVEKMSLVLLRKTYETIRQTVEEYRKGAGLSGVILVSHEPLPTSLKSVDELIQVVYSRPVIAYDPALDITDDIIKMINQ